MFGIGKALKAVGGLAKKGVKAAGKSVKNSVKSTLKGGLLTKEGRAAAKGAFTSYKDILKKDKPAGAPSSKPTEFKTNVNLGLNAGGKVGAAAEGIKGGDFTKSFGNSTGPGQSSARDAWTKTKSEPLY